MFSFPAPGIKTAKTIGEQAAADGFVNRQLAGVANCIKKLALDGVYGRGQKYRISFGCAVSPKAGNSETGDSCCVPSV